MSAGAIMSEPCLLFVVPNMFYLFFFHQMEPPKEFGTFSALLAPALLSGKKNEEGETVRSRTSTLSRKASLTPLAFIPSSFNKDQQLRTKVP